MNRETPWYNQSREELLANLESSTTGLDETVAAARLQQFGPNEIAFRKTPAWVRFLRQFNDPMVIVLMVTAVVTGILTALGSHMLPDTIVITSVVLLNAALGFVQEGKAEGALDALRNMMVQECLVLRERHERRIPARELVPGDIVVLEAGDKIPGRREKHGIFRHFPHPGHGSGHRGGNRRPHSVWAYCRYGQDGGSRAYATATQDEGVRSDPHYRHSGGRLF